MTNAELSVILEEHKKWLNGLGGSRANLREANLREANLYGANLREACLRRANLCEADLHEADLRRADLRGAKNVPFIPMACPEKGGFIGFKKLNHRGAVYIVELEIPAEAKRCSATTEKCRCEFARVVSISTLDGNEAGISEIANSNYSPSVTYKVGEMVYPDSFDEDRWNECSHGIHFFINRQSAVEY